MTVGLVMLVHRDFGRAAEVACHLAASGAPVAVHVDSRAKGPGLERMKMRLSGNSRVLLRSTHACEWGMWPIVEATRETARALLGAFPEVTHVALLSGACLPIRPINELRAFLAAHPRTDFIESVAVEDVAWTCGGLESERFSLWFPFSWKRRRRIFDGLVELQRMLRISRRRPDGLVPHIGSQWWCLTRETLEAIFADPEAHALDRYFRRTWIPDESYFQTLARRHARRIDSRSLTLARFDCHGRPHAFYDDHLELLSGAPQFFARKVWPGADSLYSRFLSQIPMPARDEPAAVDRLVDASARTRRHGRKGLVMQGRYPRWSRSATARSYAVLQGHDAIFRDFRGWLSATSGGTVHGRLMHPDRIESAGDLPGGLAQSVALRDYDPAAFLRNLLWNSRDRRQTMLFSPGDAPGLWQDIARDHNARVSVITGAWAIGLWRAGGEFGTTCQQAATLLRAERAQIALLEASGRENIRVESLADFLNAPTEGLRWAIEAASDGPAAPVARAPQMHGLDGFPDFLNRLRDAGYPVGLAGRIASESGILSQAR